MVEKRVASNNVVHKYYKCVAFYDTFYFRTCGLPFAPTFRPDLTHPYNAIDAMTERSCVKMPEPGPTSLVEQPTLDFFYEYCKCFIIRYLKPLTDTEIPNFEEWLTAAPYTKARKEYFRKLRSMNPMDVYKLMYVQTFIKAEGYLPSRVDGAEVIKHPRLILSRMDFLKTVLGNYAHAMDERIFSLPWFVKHTNPREWPERVDALFGHERVMQTDFTSMEAHHRGVFAKVINFLFMHLLRGTTVCPNSVKRLISRIVLGMNHLDLRTHKADIPQRLMSGEMWTSSANGMLNLLLMSFMVMKTKFPNLSASELARLVEKFFKGLFEGDDGLTSSTGVDKTLIDKLGLKLKFEYFDHYSQASFCGIVCDPLERKVVSDPFKTMRNFFELPQKYVNARKSVKFALLRARAMSMAYTHHDSPVLGELAHWMCAKTKGLDVSRVTTEIEHHKRHIVELARKEKSWDKPPCVSMSSRIIVEKVFKMPVAMQLYVEKRIRESVDTIDIDIDEALLRIDIIHAATHLIPAGSPLPPLSYLSHLHQETLDHVHGIAPDKTLLLEYAKGVSDAYLRQRDPYNVDCH